jgi:NAD(P)-dependent dehydrogenase (short-subunit alcohol dehydrogenase family)
VKVASITIVTGGTGALGQAVTRRFLADGASVAVPWVVPGERDSLVERLMPDERPRVLLEECDVIDPAAMERFVARVTRDLGAIDVLVTTVGGFAGGDLASTDLASWERMLRLNLTSVFVAARSVVPRMVARGYGRVVTVASRAVVPPTGGFIGYTVSKAGVITLTQALAAETRGSGVTINAVLPSTMDTPANRAAMPDADPASWVPVERVAEAIAFLARRESSEISGTLLAI